MKNPNHPKKGSRITVDPIREIKAIKSISKLLGDNPRDLLLFTLSINTGLRVGDLLKLKAKDVISLKIGGTLIIRESKTKKDNVLVVNKAVYKALQNFQLKVEPSEDNYLFASRKGDKPITIQAVNNLVKKWTGFINLRGNYGAHSLRKTWGYHQRVAFGTDFSVISKRYMHSNPSVTMRYLGIEDKEVHNILLNEVG